MMSTDATLVNAWSAGDEAAGQALFHRHYAALRRFFRKRSRAGASEDLVQRTLLGCVEARTRFRGDSSFRTFLFQIARYQLLTHLREERRERGLELELCSLSISCAPASEPASTDHELETQKLLPALEALPEHMREALDLIFWSEIPAIEAADMLCVSTNTVYTRVHRAKHLLRQLLGGD